MLHRVFGRKLGRNKDERRRLFRNLCLSMITYGRVRTTLAKAKAVRSQVERLITKAKHASSAGIREMNKTLGNGDHVARLLDMAKKQFGTRNSGYTRIVRIGTRRGDASEMVYLEFVDQAPVSEAPVKTAGSDTGRGNDAPPVVEAQIVQETEGKKPKKVKSVKKKK